MRDGLQNSTPKVNGEDGAPTSSVVELYAIYGITQYMASLCYIPTRQVDT